MIVRVILLLIHKFKGIKTFQVKKLIMEMQLLALMIRIRMTATAVHPS